MTGMVVLLLFVGLPILLIVAAVSAPAASAPIRKLIGGILQAVGILLMTGSGLCSITVLLSGGSAIGAWALLVLFVGGLPFASGFGVFMWGRSLIRIARLPDDGELGRRFD